MTEKEKMQKFRLKTFFYHFTTFTLCNISMFKPTENFIIYSNEDWFYVEISFSSSQRRLLPQIICQKQSFYASQTIIKC